MYTYTYKCIYIYICWQALGRLKTPRVGSASRLARNMERWCGLDVGMRQRWCRSVVGMRRRWCRLNVGMRKRWCRLDVAKRRKVVQA